MSLSIVTNRPALVAFFEENDCLVEETDPGKYLKMHLGPTDFKILDQFAHLQRTDGVLCVCYPCCNLVGSRTEEDRAD